MDKKFSTKLDFLYKRVEGGYFGILTAIIGGITILTCSILYYLAEPFDFFSNWISDLGGVVTNSGRSPNGSNIVFSVGLILLSIISVPFIYYLLKYLLARKQRLKMFVYLAVISCLITYVGVIGVSIIDIKTDPIVHTYFATLFFLGGMAIMLFFSLAMAFNNIPRKQVLFGFICASIPLIFISTFAPYAMQGENVFLLVVSTDPKMGITRFWEWMYLFALLAWFFETGLFLLKNKVINA
nr:hypothetical protein [Candidatus Sigynarchaeota archaeon]